MQAPEELTAEVNDEILNNMRWELSLVGLNTGEINQQVDALIEDNDRLQLRDGGV
jgi:regulator of replication initiation timing